MDRLIMVASTAVQQVHYSVNAMLLAIVCNVKMKNTISLW